MSHTLRRVPEHGAKQQWCQLPETVARLRAAGYPTPRWLVAGATSDGYVYQVQEFVSGLPAHPLTAPAAERLRGA